MVIKYFAYYILVPVSFLSCGLNVPQFLLILSNGGGGGILLINLISSIRLWAAFETRCRARHRSAWECVDIEGIEWKKPADSGWWMAEGHRSLGRNDERGNGDSAFRTPGWVIQSALMREKRKIKQPSINRKCVRARQGRMLHLHRLLLIKIDECKVEWSILDVIWIICYFVERFAFINHSVCLEYGGIMLRNILNFMVKYPVKSIYMRVNLRFVLFRDLNEKFARGDQLGRCIF